MNSCILRVKDHVNIKLEGVSPEVRREIVEACKFPIPSARHSQAYKLGRWDGKKAFFSTGGASYINMLDKIYPILEEHNYEIELVDESVPFEGELPEVSETMLAHKVWPKGHPIEGEPVILRDYQVGAIRTYFKNPKSIQQISTGAGKTLITAAISSLIEPFGRTIVIVPSKSLVEQTEEDFINLGLDVGVYYGDRKEFGHKHTISTWQSLSVMWEATRQDTAEVRIDEFLEGIVCFQVDEAHSAKADVLADLLNGPMAGIPLRWGMTGTVPKEDFNFATVLTSIGPVSGYVHAKDLQDQGVLAECHIHIEQLDDSHTEFPDYQSEHHYLTLNKARLAWLAGRTEELASNGNVLVLVNNIETGKTVCRHIPGSVFISGAVKTKDRSAEFKQVQTTNNKIIVATYGVAAVGINIPRIFNLVLFEAGSSSIRVIQSIGRGLRMAKDKSFVDVYDICSSLKFSKRHLTKRKKFYNEAQYPFTVNKIKYKK